MQGSNPISPTADTVADCPTIAVADRKRRVWRWSLRCAVPVLAVVIAATVSRPVSAVPAFTDQTGQPCAACHVGGFGPQLTDFGREFKLGGYTMRAKKSIPLAVMAIGSLTHTAKGQDLSSSGFVSNDNLAFDQGSLFVAGGVNQHIGGFAQFTYDGVNRQFHWDNLDVRLVNTGTVLGSDATYGLLLNNNPTVQDVWNTTPAWGFPYTGTSALAPTPGATALIDGALAQTVVGVSAYGWFNHKFYVEAGGYSSPAAGTLNWLGIDPTSSDIHGLAPYGRVAFVTHVGGGSLELGAMALKAALNPGRDRTSGYTDHYTDVGLDASWQKALASGNTVTVQGRYVHEDSNLEASCELGNVGPGGIPNCAKTHLNEWRGDATYAWHGKVSATLGGFLTTGSTNANLYAPPSFAPTNRPNSNGLIAQLDYTPWGGGNAPISSRLNVRFGVQYFAYNAFNGATKNVDGAGTNAGDNNTLRIFTWLAF